MESVLASNKANSEYILMPSLIYNSMESDESAEL